MNPDISIIIPLYNEVDNIEPLGYSIINAMQGQNYEVVLWMMAALMEVPKS